MKRQLSMWQRLQLKINGCAYLRLEKRAGWNGYLPIYIVYCDLHDYYFEDYPHGFLPNQHFTCPRCIEEAFNEKVEVKTQ